MTNNLELHQASIDLEQALRKINNRARGECGYDADAIDEEVGLRIALARGIYEMIEKLAKIEATN